VMILVLVLGLMAVLGLRASTFSTTVTGNMRAHALALEAAEAGLRYCESQSLLAAPVVTPLELPDTGEPIASRWKDGALWSGPGKLSASVPAASVNTVSSSQSYALTPECMIERLRLPVDSESGQDLAFLITSRGFSPDATLSPTGQLISGSEVWLQSLIQY
jgi:Tfp pilus assembly protein PilX